ncbi:molecular chaperone SurA [Pseudomonas sp. C2L12B]|uniref:Chaperone SurA n=1 Tax=Pseudomonas typographi TaxID=2715964 RepID=A0ABR7YV94_9PSED|nr:molecular chaperone SurA [Pseudomonas typographi]MBD1585077.1 molecular chaperone SurA [Pseudomonas typographi]MBD1597124.1 molecular chaperone SurA [Pseudomonas typographi]
MKTKLCNLLRPALLGALLATGSAHAQLQQLDRVVAIVDNDVIMQSQLDQRMSTIEQDLAKRGGPQPPRDVLQKQVLDRLILDNLQLQIGERSGIRVTDEELNDAIGTIAQRNNMTVDQFRAALAHDGLSYEQTRSQVRDQIIISRVRQRRVADRIQVSEQEVKNFLASDLGKAQLSEEYHLANITIPLPQNANSQQIQEAAQQATDTYQQLKQGADFGQMALARSAADNALDRGDMGWRQAAQLPPPFDRLLATLQPGDITQPVRAPGGFIIVKLVETRGNSAEVRDEVHVRHILIKPSEIRSSTETKVLIDRIYQRLMDGEDFAALAKAFSEDPGSALNGGDMGWIDPASVVPQFRDVMAQTATEEVSKPFQSQYGWHILQVLGRRATDMTQQAREQQAMNILRSRKYDEELQNWLRQIRDEAYVEIKQ